jgi:ribosomal protein S27AE
VQCEACHGPGSVHIGNPAGGHIRIDQIANVCSNCHADMANPYQLPAWDGFIAGNRQWAEVQASPHAGFACTVCHDPHTSVLYDRTTSLRNDCTACHSDQNMALHADKLFVQGDYVERLSCQSCHMPLAGRNAVSVLLPAPGGDTARIGDTRTHIMYIDTLRRDYTGMLTGDGRELVRDQAGKAVVTVDFACLRCHHGKGSAFLLTLGGAGAIAEGIHRSGTQQVTNKMNTGQ